MKCRRCHKEIRNPKSVQHGYGPICWTKMQEKLTNLLLRKRSIKIAEKERDHDLTGQDEENFTED